MAKAEIHSGACGFTGNETLYACCLPGAGGHH